MTDRDLGRQSQDGPFDNLAYAKMRVDWEAKGFTGIDQALIQGDLIPQMHQLFVQSGFPNTSYLLFDAYELTTGYPCPVRSRYIVPLFTVEALTLEAPEFGLDALPGIAVFEMMSFGQRRLTIQLGLTAEDVDKTYRRFERYVQVGPKDEQGRSKPGGPPSWWNFPFQAFDVTRDLDLELTRDFDRVDSNIIEELKKRGENPSFITVFLWEGFEVNDINDAMGKVQTVVLELDRVSGSSNKLDFDSWDTSLQEGMGKMKQLIEEIKEISSA